MPWACTQEPGTLSTKQVRGVGLPVVRFFNWKPTRFYWSANNHNHHHHHNNNNKNIVANPAP